MGGEERIVYKYSILVDDSNKDSTYTEGTRPYGDLLVFKSFREIRNRFKEIFTIGEKNNEYLHKDCDIKLISSVDREISWKPLCFCDIIVEGVKENVEKVDKILEIELPGISDYLK